VTQLAGVVFSRPLALESEVRAHEVSAYMDPAWIMGEPSHAGDSLKPLTIPVLRKLCAIPKLGFVVARDPLSDSAPWHEWPDPSHRVYLYDCRDFR
jgi:hypothetical protein